MTAAEISSFGQVQGLKTGLSSGGALARVDRRAQVIDIHLERERRAERVSPKDEQRSLAMLRHPSTQAAVRTIATGSHGIPSASVLIRRIGSYLMVLAAVMTIGGFGGFFLRGQEYSGQTWQHSVSAGESLWSLAAGIESVRPIEDVMQDILDLNGLDSYGLQVGQEITLPSH